MKTTFQFLGRNLSDLRRVLCAGLSITTFVLLSGNRAEAFPGATVFLSDDYSAVSPLDDYTVQTPRGSGQSAMNVFVSGQQLTFRYIGGFGVAAAIHDNSYGIKSSCLEGDVSFVTGGNPRSACGLEWSALPPALDNRISFYLQQDENRVSIDYVINGVGVRTSMSFNVLTNVSYHLLLEIGAPGVGGLSRVKGYVDGTLFIDEMKDLSGLPPFFHPAFNVNSLHPVDLVCDNLTVSLLPPVADAGPDQTVECAGPLTTVQLDGTGSYDPDGDPITYEWSVAGVFLDDPTSATPTGDFPPGPTLATLTVADADGAFDTDDVLISIVDTEPPAVVCTTDIGVLWPPNHKMRSVEICVAVTEACTEPEDLTLTALVSSSEPDDAKGDGHHTGDVDGQDGHVAPVAVDLDYAAARGCFVGTVDLRAERDGRKDGRTYSIVTEVTDLAGNTNSASCVIVVPHNKGRR